MIRFFLLGFFAFIQLSFLKASHTIGRDKIENIDSLKSNPDRKLLVESLRKTQLQNPREILQGLMLHEENNGKAIHKNGFNFLSLNPYYPRFKETLNLSQGLEDLIYGEPEHQWSVGVRKLIFRQLKEVTHYSQQRIVAWYAKERKQETREGRVCAFRFVNPLEEQDYLLKTFSSEHEALQAGYHVTHKNHCGTCSSLKDLAVYIAKPDLTSPVRTCVRKAGKQAIKNCLINEVGFTEMCAESWAYNGANTKELCKSICLRDYGKGNLWRGLMNVMAGRFEGGNTIKLPDGREVLRPCLACDEYRSGPAFKYTAARTRRASGLLSRIKRPMSEIFWLNHYSYFNTFRSRGREALDKLADDFRNP